MGKAIDFMEETSPKKLNNRRCAGLKHGELYMYYGDGKWAEIEKQAKPAKEVFKLWKTSKYDQCDKWDNLPAETRKAKHRIVIECFDDVCDHYDDNDWSDPVAFVADMVINNMPCHLMIFDTKRAQGAYKAIIDTIEEWADDERRAEGV